MNLDLLFDVHLLSLAKVPAMVDLLSTTFDAWKVHWFSPPHDYDGNEHINSHGAF